MIAPRPPFGTVLFEIIIFLDFVIFFFFSVVSGKFPYAGITGI